MMLSASLVLFHNDPIQYESAIKSYLNGCDGILYVVDNSTTPLQNALFSHPRVRYAYAGENLGFGKAHNRAIAMATGTSDAHLLLNPDIAFAPHVLPELIRFLESSPDVGALMPRINYPDGSIQYLSKLLPTPLDLVFRRFVPSRWLKKLINRRYELHDLPQDRPFQVPSLSGCFLLIRTELLQKLQGFDERYFMYMEDVDLVRRIGDVSKVVYNPTVVVNHAYAKGSYHNKRLLKIHLHSALKYFSKWGWLFDSERSRRNRKTLEQINAQSASFENMR